MNKEDEKTTRQEPEAFSVGEFRPEDAEGIVAALPFRLR